jgi:hypothetical protein
LILASAPEDKPRPSTNTVRADHLACFVNELALMDEVAAKIADFGCTYGRLTSSSFPGRQLPLQRTEGSHASLIQALSNDAPSFQDWRSGQAEYSLLNRSMGVSYVQIGLRDKG